MPTSLAVSSRILCTGTLCAAGLAAAFVAQSAWSQQVGPPSPGPVPLRQPEPATSPATAPSTQTVLRPSPLRTLVWNAVAMSAGDADRVMGCYHAATPDGKAIVEALGHLATAVKTIRTAATTRFGEPGFDAIGFGAVFAKDIRQMEAAQFVIMTDTASVTAGGASSPILLVWKDDAWKIDVEQTYTKNPRRRAARIHAQAQAWEELAAELTDGKYKLAIEARHAGDRKVKAALNAVDARFPVEPTTESAARPGPR